MLFSEDYNEEQVQDLENIYVTFQSGLDLLLSSIEKVTELERKYKDNLLIATLKILMIRECLSFLSAIEPEIFKEQAGGAKTVLNDSTVSLRGPTEVIFHLYKVFLS